MTGMGYNEQQFSLPRWRELTVSRATVYDDTYNLRPTQGWMLIPLEQYHAGAGEAAMSGHANAYHWALAQYVCAGMGNTQIGGKALFWDDASKAIVTRWVHFFKAHRLTLIQPLIHLRRANGQEWDGYMHAYSQALGNGETGPVEVGVGVIFNPTRLEVVETIAFPLYYTGLTDAVLVSIDEGPAVKMTVERDYFLLLGLTITPNNMTTVVFSHPGGPSPPPAPPPPPPPPPPSPPPAPTPSPPTPPSNGGSPMIPRWSWDTVQTYMHCANITGEWNDAALDAMAQMSYVTFESGHKMFAPPIMDQAEAKITESCRLVKERSKNRTACMMYVEADYARRTYSLGHWLDAHPEDELHCGGKLVTKDGYQQSIDPLTGEWSNYSAHLYDYRYCAPSHACVCIQRYYVPR
eukprot:COSAG06_NODE_4797_length_3947_cov_1.454782_3_plen_407_part_00